MVITCKASYAVNPAAQTPTGLMCLSDLDQAIALTHASVVFFYPPNQTAVETLRDSLSKVLVLFYPLAGRLQWARGEGDRVRLRLVCNSAGALFVEAESDATIHDFGDFCPTPEMRKLVPSLDYDKPIDEIPLLLVQVTNFRCGGVCLGLCASHVVGDGQAMGHFISEWARIARGEQPQNAPFLDRTILIATGGGLPPEPGLDLPEFSPPPLLIGCSDSSEERNKETTVAVLKLSKEQIEGLRNKANQVATVHNTRRAFTRYA